MLQGLFLKGCRGEKEGTKEMQGYLTLGLGEGLAFGQIGKVGGDRNEGLEKEGFTGSYHRHITELQHLTMLLVKRDQGLIGLAP